MNRMNVQMAAGLLLLCGSSVAWGQLDKEHYQLVDEASDIVVGKVVRAEGRCSRERDGEVLDRIEISMQVESVEKGSKAQVGQIVVAHAWRLRYRPGYQLFAYMDSNDHRVVPAVGQSVRAFLVWNQDAGRLEVIVPNGFASVNSGAIRPFYYRPSLFENVMYLWNPSTSVMLFLFAAGSLFFVVRWRLNRHPQIREAQRKLQELAKCAH